MSTGHVLGPRLAFPRVPVASDPRQRSRRTGRMRALVGSVVVGVCVSAAVGIVFALTVVPAVAGGHTLTVLSGSMAPAIQTGAVLVVLPVSIEDVSVGEIVTYAGTDPLTGAGTLVTHRVVQTSTVGGEPLLTTKGDANDISDVTRVGADELRGRVWYQVPLAGTVRDAVFSKSGLMYGTAAGLLLLGFGLLRGIGRSASVARETERAGTERRRGRR